ncbi:related to CCAAT-binding factor HAPB protein [Phialocephala subalpina]|uniref:Transcriptional activator HAP2 n=1 Tax=Phialocephala subalpina TaxID=576137 RepID=A0A1L7WMD1_9HELO|nr:related to CCAAT-binding factor HAPB protein [Phialocephala subalpina]
MMEYAQYQQPPQGQHGHSQGHIQGGYPNSGQHPGAGASITSPSQQPIHSQHAVHPQASPILSSQPQQAGQGHAIHQQMNYQPAYGVQQPNMHYGMSQINPQAAAMAATAAASGTAYPYTLPDGALPQTSPRMGGGVSVKQEAGRKSPRQMNNQMGHGQVQQARRMSNQVGSPAVPNSQPIMNHAPRPSVPPMPQGQPHPQSPELVSGAVEESPLYVNAKQFHRILKRRVARQRLEEALRLTSKGRKPYLHESRHNHAMRRPRGPGGRFLTADEVAEIERTKGEGGDENDKGSLETPAKGVSGSGGGSGTKRKADSDNATPSKKAKPNAPPARRSSAEDEDDDDDDAEDDG